MISDYVEVRISLQSFTRAWPDHARALWYARRGPHAIRRLRTVRPLKRPASAWRAWWLAAMLVPSPGWAP